MDENAAVIEPQRGRREGPLPPLGILTFTPQDLELYLRGLQARTRRSQKLFLSSVHTGSAGDVPISLTGPLLGAPQAVLVLEKLIALGVRDILAAGWCGSIADHVAIGDIVLPTGAASEEGTSGHYPVPEGSAAPSAELLSHIRDGLSLKGIPFHEGKVWSTDAPYRETTGKILAHRAQGVLAVEMEASALFTVARFRGIRLAMILVVSDDLSTLKWVHGFRETRFHKARESLAEVVLSTICPALRPFS